MEPVWKQNADQNALRSSKNLQAPCYKLWVGGIREALVICPKWGSKMDTKPLLEATWGGPRSDQAAFGLLEGSWKPPEAKKKVLLTRSEALQEEFQDSSQLS